MVDGYISTPPKRSWSTLATSLAINPRRDKQFIMTDGPRLQDLARAADTSVTAVSAVLHGGAVSIRVAAERRERIIAVARTQGYRPSQDLAVIAHWEPGTAGESGLRFLHALRAAWPHAVQVHVAGPQQLPEAIARWKVGAVVAYDHDHDLVRAHCAARGIPYVVANPATDTAEDAIIIDDGAGISEAARRLLTRGCRRLALCAPRIRHQAHTRRIAAVRAIARRRGVPCIIADATDFRAAVTELALDDLEPCGVLVLADWYLGLDAVVAGRGHQLACIKRPWSPWVHAPLIIDTPWDAVAAACVRHLTTAWAGGPAHREAPIPTICHEDTEQ